MSATSSVDMSSEDSDKSSEIAVQEVRRGLFRLRWNLDDVRDGPCREEFTLRGSQSGNSYMISCYPKPRLTEWSNRRRDKPPYYVRFSLKTVNSEQQDEDDIEFLSCVSSVVSQVSQVVGESSTASQRHTAANESCLTNHPLYVWLSRENGRETRMSQSESGTWRLGTYGIFKQPAVLTFWMDFGTSTVGEIVIKNGLAQLFHQQTACDVQFRLKHQKSIGAHEAILTAGSPVFAAMFRSDLVECQTRTVTIADLDLDVFNQLLVYLYTGKAPELESELITQSLYEAADKYAVEPLKNECVEVLLTRIELSNVVDMLVWSHHRSIPKLVEASMKFVASNGRQLCFQPQWMELMTTYPDLCLLATQRIVCRLTVSDSEDTDHFMSE